jgi:hypothetical protein
MNATPTWFKAAALAVMVSGTMAASGCSAEILAEPVEYPPQAFVATTAPVYYQGRPAYWYNERWYYRTGGGWGYYRVEPGYLNRRRTVYGAPAHEVRPGGEVRGEVRVR